MKILLATDASKNAEVAAEFLLKTPSDEPFEILLFSVIQLPELHHLLVNKFLKQNFIAKRSKAIEESFNRIEAILDDRHCRFERRIVEGRPGREIVDEAEKEGCGLVVVGAVGSSLLDRILLGSTGEYVATNAHCPVLVVRPNKFSSDQHPSRKWLTAYDGSEPCKSAIQFAADQGFLADAALQITEVVDPLPSLLLEQDNDAIQAQIERESQESIAAFLKTPELRGLEAEVKVIEGDHVGNTLCELAEWEKADAMIVGHHGKGVLERLLIGSTTRHILQHAPCSVLVGR